MITYVSDLNMDGSGYVNIGVQLCDRLAESEKVVYLGLDYYRQEHPYRFSAVPLPGLQHIAPMIGHLKPRYNIVALDIPLQVKILQDFKDSKVPYVGIFPVEAGPLAPTWAASLWKMKKRFAISRYGVNVCAEAGLDVTFLPPAMDIGDDIRRQWRRIHPDDKQKIRQKMNLEDKFVILQVADNHERKNLSRALEIVADLVAKGLDVQYFLVTRIDFVGGWLLSDLVEQMGLSGHVQLVKRGLPHEALWSLYAAADMTLLTSKSEGACLPILESMATGTLVVGTDCTAISDHLAEGRGIPVEWDYRIIDPFGNAYRYFISKDAAVEKILRLADMDAAAKQEMADKAYQYVQGFSTENSIRALTEELKTL